MKRLWPLIVAASLACGSGSRQQFQLQIASPNSSMVDGDSTKLRMQAGEKLIVALVVVGHAPGQVRYSSQNLPAFGTLDGSLLTLSPARSQAGEYSFTLTATAGSDSQSATLSVSVGRYNSAPTWRPYANWEDEYGDRHFI